MNCAESLSYAELLRYRKQLFDKAKTNIDDGLMLLGVEALIKEREAYQKGLRVHVDYEDEKYLTDYLQTLLNKIPEKFRIHTKH